MMILSRKHFGTKQHWEPLKVKGSTQTVDFEWKTHWSQTTLETIEKIKGTTQNVDFEQEAVLPNPRFRCPIGLLLTSTPRPAKPYRYFATFGLLLTCSPRNFLEIGRQRENLT